MLTHDEDDKETTEPDQQIDGQLLSPRNPDVLSAHLPNGSDDKVRHHPRHTVNNGEPSLAATADWDFCDGSHLRLLALLGELLSSFEVLEHITITKGRYTGF